jgi:hypothetical protein
MSKRFIGMGLENTMVGKNGYIYGNNTFSGIAYTQNGPLYFAIFLSYPDTNRYRDGVRAVEELVQTLLSNFVLTRFNYSTTLVSLASPISSVVSRPF